MQTPGVEFDQGYLSFLKIMLQFFYDRYGCIYARRYDGQLISMDSEVPSSKCVFFSFFSIQLLQLFKANWTLVSQKIKIQCNPHTVPFLLYVFLRIFFEERCCKYFWNNDENNLVVGGGSGKNGLNRLAWKPKRWVGPDQPAGGSLQDHQLSPGCSGWYEQLGSKKKPTMSPD